MSVAITGMIAHGNLDVKYAHYGLDAFPTNPNHTIGSIAKLLRDLEELLKNSSRKLFSEENTQSLLTKAVLQGSDTRFDSLLPLPQVQVPAQSLPLYWSCSWIMLQVTIRIDGFLPFVHSLYTKAFSAKCTSTSS